MLPIFFKRLNAIPIYHFMIGILFFALFFPNSNLSSFLYSQLGYIEFGTNLASSAFVRTKCILACWGNAQSPKTMKINFHGATPIGFVILMCFQHFINSSLPFPIYEIIFYTDSVYPKCWKNFVFINFSNIRNKAGKEFLFISW